MHTVWPALDSGATLRSLGAYWLVKGDDKIAGDAAEYLGPTEDVRFNALFRGGLRIYTSYDPLLQWQAREAVKTTIAHSKSRLVPKRSAAQPLTGMNTASASV